MLEEDVEMQHCSGAAGAGHSVTGSGSAGSGMPVRAEPKVDRPSKRSNKMAGASSTEGKQSVVQVQ